MARSTSDHRRAALRRFMKERKLRPSPWAKRAGIPEGSIRNYLVGRANDLSVELLERLADAESTSVDILLGRAMKGAVVADVPLIGYVGAGEMIHSFDGDSSMALERASAPPGFHDGAAVVVRGDSMTPAYREGDVLYYEQRELAPDDAVGRDCIVQVVDGPLYVKRVARGTRRGLFDLVSHNNRFDTIRDARLAWAARVAWVRRSK